jgi:hypothetical protein
VRSLDQARRNDRNRSSSARLASPAYGAHAPATKRLQPPLMHCNAGPPQIIGPPLQTLPGWQQGSPTPPQPPSGPANAANAAFMSVQVLWPFGGLLQTSPALQELPAQQGWFASPHAGVLPALGVSPGGGLPALALLPALTQARAPSTPAPARKNSPRRELVSASFLQNESKSVTLSSAS